MILANSNDSRDVATTLGRKRPPRYSQDLKTKSLADVVNGLFISQL